METIKVTEEQWSALVTLLPEETAIGDLRLYWLDQSLQDDGVALSIVSVSGGERRVILNIGVGQ